MLRSCNGYLDINDEKNMSDKTVLVVDDETAIRDMICSALDVAGFDTLQAENAQQAMP
jgi:two-component system phosphate regulon response regulator PhoB